MKLINNSKKILNIVLVLSLIWAVTACSGRDSKPSTSSTVSNSSKPSTIKSAETTKPTDITNPSETTNFDNSSAKIGVMTQEYIGNNIAEILMISYDGEKKSEIESLNNAVKSGIMQIYDDFIKTEGNDPWIEVRSYPFSSENYLQIVTTCSTYPSYGRDGDMYSYNFDLNENRFISIDDILKDLQLDRDSIADTVFELLEDEDNDGATAKDVDIVGFLITQGPSGSLIQLLLQVDMDNPGADIWNSFFGYTPELGEIIKLNSECLFDPSDIDQMDIPLSYQTEIVPFAISPGLAIDTSGLEVLTQGCEYMYDGMVYYTVEELAPVAYSEDEVLKQIKSLEFDEIRLQNITESDEHMLLLNSPCWLVVYYEGENEDTRFCVDVYVQTETADYRLHSSVMADFKLDYHDEIGMRLATVYWNE